jgi:hypothetical protein
MSILDVFKTHYSALGPRGLITAPAARLSARFSEVKARSPRAKHPIYLRTLTSDIPVYTQVFKECQYNFELPSDPTVIIDAGANIGLASVFFATRYPEARIVSLEADSENFAHMRKNVAPFTPFVRP